MLFDAARSKGIVHRTVPLTFVAGRKHCGRNLFLGFIMSPAKGRNSMPALTSSRWARYSTR